MEKILKGRALAVAALVALLGLTACEDDEPAAVDQNAVARVEIVSANLTMLEVDSTIQLQARAYNAANGVLTVPITWSTSNTQIATISNTGLLRTLDGGDVTITAAAGGKNANFQLAVEHKAASITLATTPPAMRVAGQYQLQVQVLDPHGKVLQRQATYTSLNPDVVAITPGGAITALKVGTATIQVTSEGVTSTFEVVVMARVGMVDIESPPAVLRIGQNVQVNAVIRDGAGNILTDRPVQWSSSNTAVATVDANGVITGVAQGNANITALSETITATFSIVVASQVSTVTLWPTLLTVDEGNQAALHASALDLNGTEVPGTTPVWTSSDTRVVTVDQNGVVTAVGYGVADVSVTVDGVTVTAQVVVPARVDALTVSPCFLYMKPGDADQLSATLYDPAGMVVNTDISWYSNAPAVVSVSQSGMVTANAPGTAMITVTAGAKTRTVYVKVRAPVADIIVPESLMIRAGWEAQLYPILKDEHGNVLTGRIINYSSSNNWVAWVSPSGRIHAQHVGHVHITVESEGVSRVVQVNVYVPKPW